MSDSRRLFRSRSSKVIGGVCGGIGDYFNIDPVIIRLIMIFIVPAALLIYIIMWIVVPEEPLVHKETEKEVW
ncbi:MAG: PspC domain-containing protein [Caldisericia bacterium]|nr:PspC domain-containing protein [Caldisericia bacterium]